MSDNNNPAPEGICPNCWGKQEYGGKFKEIAEDRQIDINNKNSQSTRAFVQDFIVNYLSGIKLKKQEGQYVCQKCKTGYKEVPSGS